jgi:hypothetical protein
LHQAEIVIDRVLMIGRRGLDIDVIAIDLESLLITRIVCPVYRYGRLRDVAKLNIRGGRRELGIRGDWDHNHVIHTGCIVEAPVAGQTDITREE